MASFTGEYDSNTFTGEKMEQHLSSCFFQSDYRHKSCFSESTSTFGAAETNWVQLSSRGACQFFFASGCLSIPFISSQWLLWRKVTSRKCGSSSQYKHNFEWASVLCGSVNLLIIVSFFICEDYFVGQHLLLFFHGSLACFLFLFFQAASELDDASPQSRRKNTYNNSKSKFMLVV